MGLIGRHTMNTLPTLNCTTRNSFQLNVRNYLHFKTSVGLIWDDLFLQTSYNLMLWSACVNQPSSIQFFIKFTA